MKYKDNLPRLRQGSLRGNRVRLDSNCCNQALYDAENVTRLERIKLAKKPQVWGLWVLFPIKAQEIKMKSHSGSSVVQLTQDFDPPLGVGLLLVRPLEVCPGHSVAHLRQDLFMTGKKPRPTELFQDQVESSNRSIDRDLKAKRNWRTFFYFSLKKSWTFEPFSHSRSSRFKNWLQKLF